MFVIAGLTMEQDVAIAFVEQFTFNPNRVNNFTELLGFDIGIL